MRRQHRRPGHLLPRIGRRYGLRVLLLRIVDGVLAVLGQRLEHLEVRFAHGHQVVLGADVVVDVFLFEWGGRRLIDCYITIVMWIQ